MRRRTFVGALGGTALAGVAGCLTRDGERGGDEDTLRVATYDSMVDGNDPAGPWLKEAFEEEYPDAELEWQTPENGTNRFIQREQSGEAPDADVYLGLNVDELARIDDALGEGGLFRKLDRDRLDRADRIRDGLDMGDPHDRVLAYDTGYISLVYDENVVDEPESLDALTEPAYEDALLAQNAQSSDPGRAFLLWTIDAYGEDGYLDYWRDLDANGVRILDDWDESYNSAYMEEERPMVVSYSTDQVFASAADYDMGRHQIAFPDGQGYANPEGMAIFEDAAAVDRAYQFFDFVLSDDAQAEIAQRNVQFPAVADDHVDLDEEFDRYAHEPSEAVTVGYDQLRGTVDEWVDEWAREFAGQ
ncbi:thiamine ABC transporter substrate-binding protein [Natrinema salifodinae]|uniref:Thiamine transport system substrate-binding protein n=1 Tax=Natrinema salifodinae TaxID=1202768 RepID=A0A1I0QFS0_9EURY|nr:thiamine ABC transporter substrate-binding protein [Natrinema salifodinae]SEW25902.1 thiamine transport system substrate-binding protein [Natrinema salifodinae]